MAQETTYATDITSAISNPFGYYLDGDPQHGCKGNYKSEDNTAGRHCALPSFPFMIKYVKMEDRPLADEGDNDERQNQRGSRPG